MPDLKGFIGGTLVLPACSATAAAQHIGRTLDEAIQRATGGGPWGAILVAREGEVLLAKGSKKLELSDGIEIVILPQYVGRGEDGRPVEDKRVILVAQDTGRHFRAAIVKMNLNAARKLLEHLRGAVR